MTESLNAVATSSGAYFFTWPFWRWYRRSQRLYQVLVKLGEQVGSELNRITLDVTTPQIKKMPKLFNPQDQHGRGCLVHHSCEPVLKPLRGLEVFPAQAHP